MADDGLNELLDRLRGIAPYVDRTEITERFGIAPRTLYRCLRPGYYFTKKPKPHVVRQIRRAVEELESQFGHDVPRETQQPSDVSRKAEAFDLIAEVVAITLSRIDSPASDAAIAGERAVRAKMIRSLLDRQG